MLNKNDWRLVSQDEYLMNAKLKRVKYSQSSPKWDHEHCVFCWDKFSESEDDLHEGYCTEDMKYWICDACYEDFKDTFHFEIV